MSDVDESMVKVWRGPERRSGVSISEAQLTELVERAANIAAERAAKIAAEQAAVKAVALIKTDFYRSVGEGVVSKMLWIIGALIVAAYVWAKQQGLIK